MSRKQKPHPAESQRSFPIEIQLTRSEVVEVLRRRTSAEEIAGVVFEATLAALVRMQAITPTFTIGDHMDLRKEVIFNVVHRFSQDVIRQKSDRR